MSITLIIIAVTCLVSFPAFGNEPSRDRLLFWPYYISGYREYHRFITAGFVHADVTHLLFNMISLYSFGTAVEEYMFPYLFERLSTPIYILLYFSALAFSSVPDFFKHRHDVSYRALGASGAVSAVIFSAITIRPDMPIRFFFIPIDIPGYIFGLLFLGFSYYLAKKGSDNIGHNAHFWGSVYGIFFTWLAAKLLSGIDLFRSFLAQFPG